MPTIKKATIKSYSAATHKATVQIAGSLGVWLDAIRVATDIPAADVVAGCQCTVLFLDPANQDDAVIIAIQGALPSVGAILHAAADAGLTLTTSYQDVSGATVTLPTPGDWLITATFAFTESGSGDEGQLARGQLLADGVAQSPIAFLILLDGLRATVVQTWKVTTTATDVIAKLQAKKDGGTGSSVASATATTITAAGVQRSTGGGGVTDHALLTNLPYASAAHTDFAGTAVANVFAALQTFNAGLRLAAAQQVQDSAGTGRILLATASPHLNLTGDAHVTGRLGVASAPASDRYLNVSPAGASLSGSVYFLAINPASSAITATGSNIFGVFGAPSFSLSPSITGVSVYGLNYLTLVTGGSGATIATIRGLLAQWGPFIYSGTVTSAAAMEAGSPYVLAGSPTVTYNAGLLVRGQNGAVIVTTLGIDVEAITAGTNRYGLRVGDMTGGTIARILELGPATPHLRLEGSGNWAPGINTATSPLLLLMGNNDNPLTKTLRRVQWKDGATLAAGDKVLIAV